MDSNQARYRGIIDSADWEVIGFNGIPGVECGRDLAIVRHIPTDRYHRLLDGVAPPAHTLAEIEAYEGQGRLTRLSNPINLSRVPSLRRSGVRLAEVVWYQLSFLPEVGMSEPLRYHGELLDWQPAAGGQYRAACASGIGAPGLLNLWGRELLRQVDILQFALVKDKWKKIKYLADIGLCASIESSLRYKHYLRYVAAQQYLLGPGYARRTFDCFICREFPEVSWLAFDAAVNSILQERVAYCPHGDQISEIATVRPSAVLVA